jgi:glycosyltransferase involved in cell wall biosynthesis
MLTFMWLAIRHRPDIVGGFHLLVNGLVAGLLARLVGARSLYFCVGGPMEVLGGGVWAENRIFGLLETPDPMVERGLIRAVGELDLVVTMGTGAVTFFRQHGVDTDFRVISGSIDTKRFSPTSAPRPIDLILVGRLAVIKRIDLFLRAVGLVAKRVPTVTAVVVGDGPLRGPLERLSRELGIQDRVSFAGHQSKVEDWLRRARVFVLTSDSEGLALSVMEAMASGLPAVVSDVGDLGDLVVDGVNGHLVTERSPEAFAERIVELLTDEARRVAMSRAAISSAQRYEPDAVARQWEGAIGSGSRAGVECSFCRGTRQ